MYLVSLENTWFSDLFILEASPSPQHIYKYMHFLGVYLSILPGSLASLSTQEQRPQGLPQNFSLKLVVLFSLCEVSQGTKQSQGEGLTKITEKEEPWDKCEDSSYKWEVFVLGDRISETRVERRRQKYRFCW